MRVKAAALGLFVAALAWRFATFTGFTNDHYATLALANQMLLGDRPIRDFADPGWPLQYLVSAAAWRLVDGAMVGEWAVMALAFAAGAAFTVLAAHRLSGSLAIAIVVTLAEILIAPRTYSYPKVLPYAAAAWVMVSTARVPAEASAKAGRRLVLLGLIVALAFLFRHDHGVYIGAAAVVYTMLASYREGVRRSARAVGTLAGAVVIFLMPWLVYVQVNGGLTAYLERGIEFSRAEARATMLDYLPAFDPAPALFTASNADAWLFWLFWILPVLCGAVAIVRALRGRQRWPGELATVAALFVLALLVNVGFVRHVLHTRLPDAIVPAALLGAWLLGVCWKEGWQRPGWQRVARAASLAALLVSFTAVVVTAGIREQIDRLGVTRGVNATVDHLTWVSALLRGPHRQTLSPPGRVSETLMPFYAYLDRCSTPADRLIVASQSPDVLVLAGRKFAGEGAVFAPGYALSSESGQRRTIDWLRAMPALFAVMVSREDFREAFPLIDEYVADAYQPMTTIAGSWPDGIPILVERSRTPAHTDSETGWPCFR